MAEKQLTDEEIDNLIQEAEENPNTRFDSHAPALANVTLSRVVATMGHLYQRLNTLLFAKCCKCGEYAISRDDERA